MHDDAAKETILIVDDTPENLQVLGDLLRTSYLVRVAISGERALEVIQTPPLPDMILLDVMMPGLNGYECLKRLKEIPHVRDVPVVFVTALDSGDDERLGLEIGAADYITKPISPAIVLARVRNLLDTKRARDWLKEQNKMLEAELNRLLEILAHHLQEPVRRQVTFTQLLQRSLPRPINEMAALSMNQIVEGATRQRAMLNDVLLYLTATQQPPPTRTFSSESAFNKACRQLRHDIKTSNAEVSCGNLPAVWMSGDQLISVFHALLANAIRYVKPEIRPQVHVSAEVGADSMAVFVVSDNGVGILPEFREKVFTVFERLHNDPSLPGTGIGLSLVKKMVDLSHGKVWIEGNPDGGTRVCFSVPTKHQTG
jgi:two-component system sensor histidine kinase/response regulator